MAVDGTYQVKGEAMGATLKGTLTLTTSGTALTGTANIEGVEAPIEDGKAVGNELTGVVASSTPMGNMKFKVQAKVSGDTITGSLRAGLVKASFTGKRVD